MKKLLIVFIFFYFLVLFQTSFLIRFSFFLGQWTQWLINLVIIAVLLLIFFEAPKGKTGILAASWVGFLLDIFSDRFIGFHILILVGLAIFIKIILKKYVRPLVFYKKEL